MITNKIISIIVAITSFVFLPVQIVTTFVLGLLVSLTFGLLLIPLSIVWVVFFLGPLLGLSYVYERVPIMRPFIALIGIPFAVLGNIYVALIPSMGEMDSRYEKLILCQTFPYTWKFIQFQKGKIKLWGNDILTNILEEVATSEPLGRYLDPLMADVYSDLDFTNEANEDTPSASKDLEMMTASEVIESIEKSRSQSTWRNPGVKALKKKAYDAQKALDVHMERLEKKQLSSSSEYGAKNKIVKKERADDASSLGQTSLNDELDKINDQHFRQLLVHSSLLYDSIKKTFNVNGVEAEEMGIRLSRVFAVYVSQRFLEMAGANGVIDEMFFLWAKNLFLSEKLAARESSSRVASYFSSDDELDALKKEYEETAQGIYKECSCVFYEEGSSDDSTRRYHDSVCGVFSSLVALHWGAVDAKEILNLFKREQERTGFSFIDKVETLALDISKETVKYYECQLQALAKHK